MDESVKKIVIHPHVPSQTTELFVGRHLLSKELLSAARFVIVVDQKLKDLYGDALAHCLRADLIAIPSGEKAKSKQVLDYLLEELFQLKVGKDTVLVALGGGAVCDLVGFAASIYMRGIAHVLVPTTLLAMVDAAIGGKTGIDMPFGKNLIGTIYPPKAIIADVETLSSLPETEWINGLAEIIKIGLIYDADICDDIEPFTKNPALVLKAMQAKIAIVQQDPLDRSLRRMLNFGHTIGHGLEAVADYQIPHGRAVAIGCLAESHLSWQLGYLSMQDFLKIQALFHRFSLQLPKGYTPQALLHAMSYDKKKSLGKLRFVLIDQIGRALPFDGAYCRNVDHEELKSTLDWMEEQYG
jgi:3-dehydroquinate synthase